MHDTPASSGDIEGLPGERLFLVTKLAMPPVRADLVARPRLVNQLTLGVQGPLTLIAAPAGFGKTTLLSTWLEQASLRSAWLSLEQDDDDLTRFWSYVFAALSRVHQGLEASALALLQGSTPPARSPATSIYRNRLDRLDQWPRCPVPRGGAHPG